MTAGYYIKVEHLFWTGRFHSSGLVLTERASRALRMSTRIIAEDCLEEIQKVSPNARLISVMERENDPLAYFRQLGII
jgi:hypothetical protein